MNYIYANKKRGFTPFISFRLTKYNSFMAWYPLYHLFRVLHYL